MKPEQIITMAREVGIKASVGKTDAQGNYHEDKNALFSSIPIEWLTRFATLVAAHEREECAKVCEKLISENFQKPLSFDMIATAIRARGQE